MVGFVDCVGVGGDIVGELFDGWLGILLVWYFGGEYYWDWDEYCLLLVGVCGGLGLEVELCVVEEGGVVWVWDGGWLVVVYVL